MVDGTRSRAPAERPGLDGRWQAMRALPLAEALARHIEETGPMPFYEWMRHCLYDEARGYYDRPGHKTGPGPDADFVTPPTLHPFFGEAVGREIHAIWKERGVPERWTVVEYGGGEGDLCRDALAWMDRDAPDLAARIHWVHVEQGAHGRALDPRGDERIVVAEPGFVMVPLDPDGDGHADLVLACEFVDALPFALYEATGETVDPEEGPLAREVLVDWDGTRFVEVLKDEPEALWPFSSLGCSGKARLVKGQRVVDSYVAQWMDDAVGIDGAKDVLVIDYGDRAQRLWTPDRMDGTVRGYRSHQLVDSVLESPGEVDITASVDFDQVAAGGDLIGLEEVSFETLEGFLLRHGVLDALNAIARDTSEGASSYLRLRQLLLPGGLGAQFKVQRLGR